MTNEKAIETIKVAISEVEWNYPMDYVVAFEKAIEALEKQIPKKPIKTGCEGDMRIGVCECGANLIEFWKYCPTCGQANRLE